MNKLASLVLSLLLSGIIFQCYSQELSSDDQDIIALMVDKFSRPLPPPPPPESKDTIIPESVMDSLLNVKMTIAIHPKLENVLYQPGTKEIPPVYKILVDTILNINYISSVRDIYSKKKHTIVLADTLELKKSYDFEDFDLLFRFSRIWYNNEKTMAVFELGISQSRLAGFATIFCLEKENDRWRVVKSIPTTMW